jgi:superoxide dismutase
MPSIWMCVHEIIEIVCFVPVDRHEQSHLFYFVHSHHWFLLQYKNVKPDYVKAIWNVINWDTVEARLQAAK